MVEQWLVIQMEINYKPQKATKGLLITFGATMG